MTNSVARPSPVPSFCSACGHNLAAEQALAIGPLAVDPRGAAEWSGRRIPLTCAQFLTFSALVQAGGQLVSKDVLAERAGYDGRGDAHDVVQVLVCRIRHALRAVGAPSTLIETERGRGYRINVDLVLDFQKDCRP